MNEPIINPWIFYFIGLCRPINIVSAILGCVFTFLAMLTYCDSFEKNSYNFTDDELEKRNQKTRNTSKIMGIIASVFIAIAILTPTESTCYKMLIASSATKENITTTGKTINEVLDKAVKKIIRIQKGGN